MSHCELIKTFFVRNITSFFSVIFWCRADSEFGSLGSYLSRFNWIVKTIFVLITQKVLLIESCGKGSCYRSQRSRPSLFSDADRLTRPTNLNSRVPILQFFQVFVNRCRDWDRWSFAAKVSKILMHTRYKRFCYTNEIICQNWDNKNNLLQQQNV